jgi:tyrosyl-tRNA synthetase
VDALAGKTSFLASNSDARRSLKENAISVNKEKVSENYQISENDLINDTFVLLQKGKKNYYILQVVE